MFRVSLFFLLLGFSSQSFAVSSQPLIEGCERDVLLSYFPKTFVIESLKANEVPEEKWEAIAQDLAGQDQLIVQRVEERASEMTPNPLKDPQYRHEAITIFRETTRDLFTTVLNNHGIEDPELIQTMLEEVQRKKAAHFTECMDKFHKKRINPPHFEDLTK